MKYLDIVDENGCPTGTVVSRDDAHEKGIRHRTAHVWIIRGGDQGQTEILLQKRSEEKDSFPGMFDTSSAGHVPAGQQVLESAIREMQEELGIHAKPEQMRFIGTFCIRYEKVFHGKLFRDHEFTHVYLYEGPVGTLTLQASEISDACWFDLEKVWSEIQSGDRHRFCVPVEGLKILRDFLLKSGKYNKK